MPLERARKSEYANSSANDGTRLDTDITNFNSDDGTSLDTDLLNFNSNDEELPLEHFTKEIETFNKGEYTAQDYRDATTKLLNRIEAL